MWQITSEYDFSSPTTLDGRSSRVHWIVGYTNPRSKLSFITSAFCANYTAIQRFGVSSIYIFSFTKNTLNWPTVTAFIMLQNYYYYYFLFIKESWKSITASTKILSSCFNIKKCLEQQKQHIRMISLFSIASQ